MLHGVALPLSRYTLWRVPFSVITMLLLLLLLTPQAGMTSEDHPERLMIALEPEAASVYVRKLRLCQLVPETPVTQPLNPADGASTRANRYSYYAPDAAADGTSLRYSVGRINWRSEAEVSATAGMTTDPRPTSSRPYASAVVRSIEFVKTFFPQCVL